jgi:hypothetical protein
MKKTFPLQAPGKDDARVRDKIRQELNKYARRERKKKLPEGFEEWNLTCKVGASADAARELAFKEVGAAIDQVAATGAAGVYIEIVAVAGHRVFKRGL